jgi:Na+/proline symporter
MIFIPLIIYIVLIIGISIRINKKGDADSFLSSSRDRGTWSILLSKFAGAVSVSTFITYTAYAFEFGTGIVGLLIGITVGYAWFALWAAPNLNKLSAENNYITQGDFVKHQVGADKPAKYSNWISAFVQFFWVVLSIVGGAKLIEEVELMSYELAVALMIVVVAIYTMVSGLKAVLVTDIVQGLIIVVLIVIMGIGLMDGTSTSEILESTSSRIDVGGTIGFLLYGGLSVFALSDRYQLTFASKSPKTAKRGMFMALIPLFVVAGILLFVGLKVQLFFPDTDKDLAFITAIKSSLPTDLFPYLILMFFAGLMSTSDTAIFAVTSHLTWKKDAASKVKQIRILTLPILLIAGVIALFWRSILDITILGAGLRMLLSIPMIYLLLKRNSKNRSTNQKRIVFDAIVIGAVVGLLLGLSLFGADAKISILVLLLSLLGWLIGFFIARKK